MRVPTQVFSQWWRQVATGLLVADSALVLVLQTAAVPMAPPEGSIGANVGQEVSGTFLSAEHNSSKLEGAAVQAVASSQSAHLSRSLGTFVAVFAAFSVNIGKVCQKRGTQSLPLLQCTLPVLQSYFTNFWWLIGFAMDVGGAILTLVALGTPILGCGPGIVAVASYFLTSDRLRDSDCTFSCQLDCNIAVSPDDQTVGVAAGLCVCGTIGVGVTAVESGGAHEELHFSVAVLLLLFFGLGATGSEMMHRSRLMSLELAASVAAGVCFGLSACSTRCGMKLALEGSGVFGVVGVIGSVALTSTGFVAQTRGLKDGRALSVVTYSNLVALLVAVIFGLLALSEPLPHTVAGLAARAGSLLLLVGGSYLLQVGGGVGALKHSGSAKEMAERVTPSADDSKKLDTVQVFHALDPKQV